MARGALKFFEFSINTLRTRPQIKPIINHYQKLQFSTSPSKVLRVPLISRLSLFQTSNFRFFNNSNVTNTSKEREKAEQEEMETAELKKREAAWRAVKYGFLVFGGTFTLLGAYLFYDLGSPSRDEQGNIIEDEYTQLPLLKQYFNRVRSKMSYYQRMIIEPSRDKLLPDPVTHPYIQPPYTLILELTDILVHPDWTYQTGWRFKKRPGVDKFLEQVSLPTFELVIYTAEPGLV